MDVITAVNQNSLTIDQNLQLRQQFIAESCALHFEKNPMKIVRSQKQYLYDEVGNKYLDFVSMITNVGHCNETVVMAASSQMMRFTLPVGNEAFELQQNYTRKLLATMPSKFEVVLFTNSGSEANDLALQMIRKYTGSKDIVVVDGAFHGIGNLVTEISPLVYRSGDEGKSTWVHVIPVPDTYRGFNKDDPDVAEKCFDEVKKVLMHITSKGIQIGGLICEPLFVAQGLLIPPPGWLHKLISYIHELGGLVVVDEIQCGMGRTGKTFWAFQGYEDTIPDIVTVGKPLGNGYPIGAIITTRKIASVVKNADTIYRCDSVGASIGLAVLEVMQTNRLMENAINIGKMLVDGFKMLQQSHQHIGDVRGRGIMVAVDIVRSKGSTKPAPEIADDISNRMRNENILVGCSGEYKNILLFLSALCITEEDCQQSIRALDTILTSIEVSNSEELFNFIYTTENPGPSTSGSSSSQRISTMQPLNTNQDRDTDDSENQDSYDTLD